MFYAKPYTRQCEQSPSWHSNGAMVPLRKTHIGGGTTISSRLEQFKNPRDRNEKFNFQLSSFFEVATSLDAQLRFPEDIEILNTPISPPLTDFCPTGPLSVLPNIYKRTTEKLLTNAENTMLLQYFVVVIINCDYSTLGFCRRGIAPGTAPRTTQLWCST